MKANPSNISALLIAMLSAGTLLSGCGTGEASVAEVIESATPVPVETATPFRADINATYAATASIISDADAPVVARVAGEVVELLVEEGDRVQEGQILAKLDGERLRLEMLSAKANLERAEKELERNIDLHQRGLISAAMFEGLEFDVASLKATYDLKRLNYDYSSIRATIAGVISSREIKPGETLAAGQVAFRVTETSELLAYLQIPQAELAKFTVGHAATVTVASMPGQRFTATIIRISPTVDASNGTFRATAMIDNSEGNLAPGMFGRFMIAYEKHSNALVIPKHALLDEDEETSVYVVNNGTVTRRVIETGIVEDGRVEVLDGLREDERVVVVGHSGLRDGSKVLASTADQGLFAG
ncbi:MAG TPA: efflux RND transporter periplasmic adaptor subunit [Woeseiaceae bacterium]|nr:efflux RND transporter periplasmic adaptor subunit [Woeseiaceae bacterium]